MAVQRAVFKPYFTIVSCPFFWTLAVKLGVVAPCVALSTILTDIAVTFTYVAFTVSSWRHTI